MLPPLLHQFHPRVYTIAGVTAEPIAVFETLYRGETHAFLYESLQDGERRGDYSLLGGRPLIRFASMGSHTGIVGGGQHISVTGPPLQILRELLAQLQPAENTGPFSGGAVGYAAYDAVRLFEEIPDRHSPSGRTPDLSFIIPGEIIVFNHRLNTVSIVIFSETDEFDRMAVLKDAVLSSESDIGPVLLASPAANKLCSTPSKTAFCKSIDHAREYIKRGDIFQTVLSRRFSFSPLCDDLTIFKRLQLTNPSPYMYLLTLGNTRVLGSSPEILVSCRNGKAVTRPLAGTRARAGTPEQDRALAEALLSDAKERAEHIMLVDLARNDLGRVCTPGSIKVTSLMDIEHHRRVMHIVSEVEGILEKKYDAFDLFQACFPAGTVSGAPKPRAMQIIDELETARRDIYAGSIGYFGANGDMDMCIAIRTIWFKNGTGYLQAGAGIVADSDAEREYLETGKKAAALLEALGVEDR